METNDSTEQQLPLVALIGPTNAGKSTLFNRLTGSWQAVTAKEESTTRDRVYGEIEWQGRHFSLVDTGGLVDDVSELYKRIHAQTLSAVEEADLILFVFDAKAGLTETEKRFLDSLRGKKTVWLVANKIDSLAMEQNVEKLEGIGFPYHEVSAVTGRSCGDLLEEVAKTLPDIKLTESAMPIIALVGRPNVGKSTLINALTKTERAVVSPVAGTTRDIVTAELTLDGKTYLLADTAGVRRRGQIEAGAEKFSVKRTMTAIAQSSAVLVLIDSTIGTTRGDLHLIYYAHQLKKPTLLVFNKTDLMDKDVTVQHRHTGKFDQVFISALHNDGIFQIADWIKKI